MTSYARLRKQELEHIRESIKSDRVYKGTLTRLYNQTQEEITKDIVNDIERFAYKEGLSMTEASKQISKTDVKNMQNKIDDYIKSTDLSPQAKKELRKYNITMRTNRLELLQSRINLSTVNLANEEERLLTQHLFKEVSKEYSRQAGILEMTVPSTETIERMFKSVILSDVSGTTFSDRIWANQNEMRENLNNTIRRTIIRGEHPRVGARDLRKYVNDEFENKKFMADRIAITESARAQTITQEESFKDFGVEQYMFIAETDDRTCEECEGLDGKIFDVEEMAPGENAAPIHPLQMLGIGLH